ncbi:Dip2/Utp12 family-domain-containing protein [Lipomyces japonicus]|uniref:Dip2/Utp12 family-domain-containing protein n=1 Tax=Lipomyces japonicus TaxID=56871 RepID=UPI0034CF0B36
MTRRPTVVKSSKKAISALAYNESDAKVSSGTYTKDVTMADAPENNSDGSEYEDDNDENENEENFTLQDRVNALDTPAPKAHKTDGVTVTPQSNGKSRKKADSSSIAIPTSGTLSTVLTQSLRTNDSTILESCLSFKDDAVIRLTVQRLSGTLAATLLEKLAERIARTPARASQLAVWIRWVMVAHGGYLVGIPDLVKLLAGVQSTLSRHSGSLNRLLALQGRLDMLSAQIELRNDAQRAAEDDNDELDSEVEYVEGEDDEEIVLEDAGYIVGEEDDDSEEEDSDEEDDDNVGDDEDVDADDDEDEDVVVVDAEDDGNEDDDDDEDEDDEDEDED